MWQGILKKVFSVRDKVALNLSGETDQEKPFLDHLEDLRTMIVRIFMTLLLGVIGTFCFHKYLFKAIQFPLIWAGLAKDEAGSQAMLQNTDVVGPFMMAINVSLIAAIILTFPILLIFLLQFILPGLKPNEKKMLWPAIAIGTVLFLGGAAFAYFSVLPRALQFFDEFARSLGSRQDWTLSNYVTFATRFVLVFGIAFELPVIVMALVKLDILNFKIMKNTWRHALVGITLFAAIITPTPDVFTLMLMSGPLYVLYAICVYLAYLLEKKDKEAYPEYYAQIEKDEQELEKANSDDWDNENYNPWSTADEDEQDMKDEYQRPAATPSAPPPEVEKTPATGSSDEDDSYQGEDQSSVMPDDDDLPPIDREKTTEDLAREDEERSRGGVS